MLMALLQVEFSVSRSLPNLIFFLPVLVFGAYAIFCGTRLPGTNGVMDRAILAVESHKPKVLSRRWDVSVSLGSGFLQPVAIAEMEFPRISFRKLKLRVWRRPGLPGSATKPMEVWEVKAEMPIPSKYEVFYRIPLHIEENPIFVHKTALAEEVMMDPLCLKLNGEGMLMGILTSLCPSQLDVKNGPHNGVISMKFEAREANLNEIFRVMEIISNRAIETSGTV